MISIFAVYDTVDNVSRFVIANDTGFNWQTADTVTNCDFTLDSDEMIAKIVIGSWNWESLTTEPSFDQHQFTDEEWNLFKYCQFEFLKKDCKYFGTRVRLAVNELPNELYDKLTADYIKWANEEGVGCLTDGYDVFMDDSYEPPEIIEPQVLTDMKDFSKWLKDLNYSPVTNELGESYITIAVAGNSVKVPFHADTYELLDHFLDKAIEEY